MLFKKNLSFIALSSFLVANDPSIYGWNLPYTPLNIGGYIDTVYDTEEDKFMFDDIALLFSGHKNHFDLLGEVEVSHLTLDGKSNGSRHIKVIVERLQLGYAVDDTHRLTIGRFNSNVGYWNQAPINILQDVTSEPHISQYVFPNATTGIMYERALHEENRLSITLQHNADIGGYADEGIVVNRHLSLAYFDEGDNIWSWCVSGGIYRTTSKDEAYYIGMGTEYDNDIVTLQGEIFTHQNIPHSGYLQSVWHLANRHDTVLRLEHYNDEQLDTQEATLLWGYVYRPRDSMVVKGEYIHHTERPLSRFVYSFSVLF